MSGFVEDTADGFDSLVGDLAASYALIFTRFRFIGTLIPDVTLSENHTDTSTVTQHPVEGGSTVADHYFDNPSSLEIRAGYSDSSGGYPGYVNDMYQLILAQRASRQPFSVSTGSRQYDNMLFTQINVTKDADTEHALMFTVGLQQIVITSTDAGSDSSTQADPSQTGSTANTGNQSLQPAAGVGGIGVDNSSGVDNYGYGNGSGYVVSNSGQAGIGAA